MVKYIPFYPHDFFNDPRVMRLTIQEQQLWIFLIAKMMQTQAVYPENHKLIARTLDIRITAAEKLIIKLKSLGLLIASNTGEKILTLSSPRLKIEYIKAKALSEMATERAKKAAAARHHPDASSNASSNADKIR